MNSSLPPNWRHFPILTIVKSPWVYIDFFFTRKIVLSYDLDVAQYIWFNCLLILFFVSDIKLKFTLTKTEPIIAKICLNHRTYLIIRYMLEITKFDISMATLGNPYLASARLGVPLQELVRLKPVPRDTVLPLYEYWFHFIWERQTDDKTRGKPRGRSMASTHYFFIWRVMAFHEFAVGKKSTSNC